MTKAMTIILVAITIASAAGCGKKGPNIEGKWAIDLDPTLKQAQETGASSQQIGKIKETYAGTRLIIGKDRIYVSYDGKPKVATNDYKVVSAVDDCLVLEIEGKRLKYCIVGDGLRIRDPGAKFDVAYKKY